MSADSGDRVVGSVGFGGHGPPAGDDSAGRGNSRRRRGSREARSRPDEAEQDPAVRARDICLRLLTVQPRTRAELHRALIGRGIPVDVADTVLARFDQVGLVDDAAFAEQWVHSRHTYHGLGQRAIAAELRRKGVDGELAAEAVSAIDPQAEEDRAREIVRKKLRTISGADGEAKVRRLVGMLARKGYPAGIAFRVVREELRTAGEDTEALEDVVLD